MVKTMKTRIFPPLLILMVITCSRPADRVESPPDVLVSIFPLYDIVRNIAGEALKVDYVIPVGANPHHYELTPSDIERIQGAKYFIAIHPEFDGWVLAAAPKAMQTVFLGSNPENLRGSADDQDENPHIWLNPADVKILSGRIAGILSSWFPGQSKIINQQSNHYIERLDSLDRAIRSQLESVENRRFVQWHPAWDTFARAYGLEIAGTLSHGHGDKPSVKAFQNLIKSCRQNGIRVVVTGLNSEDALAESLASEIDGRLIRLDTIGDPKDPEKNTYIKLMHYNARILAESLEIKP